MSLVGAIDDATGKVPYALFRAQEDSEGYFLLLESVVRKQGIPLALYHDRHGIFEVSPKVAASIAEQLEGKEQITQFGRLMDELGITSISALSPEAKGRIERLWGTFQDRLVSELRLAGVSTLEEANHFLMAFLCRHNARFAVPPEQVGSAYRSPEGRDLETVFCFKHKRVAGADNVVRFNGHRLQILPSLDRLSYARCAVQVHEQLDSTLRIYYQGRCLDTCTAPDEAPRMRQLVGAGAHSTPAISRQPTPPAPNHPWRRWVHRANRQ
jgi:hypothetical protein